MIPHCGISNYKVLMELLYSITTYKCGVYNIPEKLQMITTFYTYYGANLVSSVNHWQKGCTNSLTVCRPTFILIRSMFISKDLNSYQVCNYTVVKAISSGF